MTAAVEEDKSNIVSNALASAAAGIIGRLFTHPLDTAKARLQSLNGASYRGSMDVMAKTFRSEGIKGLYRGFPTVIAGGTPGTVLYLCGYDIFKDEISSALSASNSKNSSKNNEDTFAVHFAAGILAEAVTRKRRAFLSSPSRRFFTDNPTRLLAAIFLASLSSVSDRKR